MSAIVVAGLVLVVGFADRADASMMLAAPLVVLGLVAVPSLGQELASARRAEIGVARLRGLYGAPLTRLLSAEPAAAVLGGALVGFPVGAAGVWWTTRRWLADATTSLIWPGWPAAAGAAGVALATMAAVLVGMQRAVREPLADQVAIAERPKASSTLAIFGSLLVIAAAAVAAYRASRDSASDPAWVVLIGPALIGLAAGQLAVWLLGALARLAVAQSTGGRLPLYLAARRLRGTAGLAGPLRLLVSATVIATLALAGASRVGQWTDRTARLSSGGPTRVPLEDGALAAYDLTHSLDPKGHWLMAATVAPGVGGGVGRRVYLDSERYDAVVGHYLDEATGADLGGSLAGLRALGNPANRPIFGDQVAFTIVTTAPQHRPQPTKGAARLELDYLNDSGRTDTLTIPLTFGTDEEVSATVSIDGCAGGCAVSALTLIPSARFGGSLAAPILIAELQVGDVDLLTHDWIPTSTDHGEATTGPAGLMLSAAGALTVVQDLGPLPVLVTDEVGWPAGQQVAESPGGVDRPARVAGSLRAAPFVQANGYLADLPQALAGDAPTIPVASTFVVARADTPEALLDALAAAGGGPAVTMAQSRAQVVAETGAGQARVFGLLAGFCLAVAMVALIASAARLRRAYRRDVASLRLLGISRAQISAASRVETMLLVSTALVLGVAGGAGAVRLLLGSLPVVRLPEHAVALTTTSPWWAPALAGLVGAAVLALVQGFAHRVGDAATRPATLREEVAG